jgi:hypothetical protein
MSTIGNVALISERPAENGYWADSHSQVAEELLNRLSTLRQEKEGSWQEVGMFDNVHCFSLPRRPDEPLSVLPMFMGKTRIEGLTPLDVFTGIRITGYRMMWEPRVQSAHNLRAFSMHNFLFYLVWRGIGPIYSPRDVAGLQAVRSWDQSGHLQDTPDFTSKGLLLGYQSLNDVPGIPAAVENCVRAQIMEAAFYIEQREGGCDLTYIGHVDLGQAIPGFVLNTLKKELPLCTGRLRDALRTFGVPPILIDRQKKIALQYLDCNPETRQVSLHATVMQPGTINLYLDYARMFTQGVVVTSVHGSAAAAISVREYFTDEDGASRRILALDLMPEGVRGEFRLIIDAADKEGPDSGTGPGWW